MNILHVSASPRGLHGDSYRLSEHVVQCTSGGWRTGAKARNPDFFSPYLNAVLGMVGLRDVTFFSMEGMALGEENAARARGEAYAAVDRHFNALHIAT